MKYKILGAIALLLGSFALGRYTVPVKVKIETKIVEVEKKVVDKQQDVSKDTHKTVTIVETKLPTGETKTVTTIAEDTNSDKKTNTSELDLSLKQEENKKEVIKDSGRTSIFMMSGVDYKNTLNGVIFGLGVNKSVLGPLTIGVWGMTNNTAGCSIGLEF